MVVYSGIMGDFWGGSGVEKGGKRGPGDQLARPGRCGEGAGRVQGGCKEGARRVQGGCKEGARRVQGGCKEGARK